VPLSLILFEDIGAIEVCNYYYYHQSTGTSKLTDNLTVQSEMKYSSQRNMTFSHIFDKSTSRILIPTFRGCPLVIAIK